MDKNPVSAKEKIDSRPPIGVGGRLRGNELTRCPWSGTDELYVKYHDEEWGVKPSFIAGCG